LYSLYDSLQRMRTQLLDDNSQSDVTVQDLEELSRDPKHSTTVHLVGRCQKVCQQGGEMQGTTDVAFFVSRFVPALQSRGLGTSNKPLPQEPQVKEKVYWSILYSYLLNPFSVESHTRSLTHTRSHQVFDLLPSHFF
jgi:hypothetical protein